MLKKRLGIEAIERDWSVYCIDNYFKIPSILIIPENCVEIGEGAFDGCWWLEKVVIPKSVEWIGDRAFWKCKIATIILRKPKSEFKEIGEDALVWCDVKEEVRN